jgi:hypothetical protein
MSFSNDIQQIKYHVWKYSEILATCTAIVSMQQLRIMLEVLHVTATISIQVVTERIHQELTHFC